MSRPPRPHPARSPGGSRTGAGDRLDYLPLEYADLLDLQRRVAVRALGRGTDQGLDVADTFMQLSALVGHVLAVYQRRFAREAFIGTAQAPSSLVRHAHRLGGEPDPGLAASGYVVLFTKPGVSGTVAAGQPLASVPAGQERAQDYETGEDVPVDSALDAVRPVHATRPQRVAAGDTSLRLSGVGLGLEAGDEVVLIGPSWQGLVVDAAEEVPDAGGQTVVRFRQGITAPIAVPGGTGTGGAAKTGPLVAARPSVRTRSFGAGADPVFYPPNAVRTSTDVEGTTEPRWWFTVSRTDQAAYRDDDVYLADRLRRPLGADWVLRSTGAGRTVFRVADEGLATVVLNRFEQVDVTPQVVTVTPRDGGFVTSVGPAETRRFVPSTGHVSDTVTVLRLAEQGGRLLARAAQPLETTWLTGWQVRAPLAVAVPNPEPLTRPLVLPGLLGALTPGRLVVFGDPLTGDAQVVRLRRVELDEAGGTTRVEWDPLTPEPSRPWTLDRLVVHGNVAPVSHGRTVRERLADSDGVTPFQRTALRESPLTHLPGAAGALPQLEVRVAGVRWTAVPDFAGSGPDDRHYRVGSDAEGVTTVVFGDGRTGAVPPAGAGIEATYRVGRGVAGNVAAGRLGRIKRAHPLLDHVVNLTPVTGGTEPAAPDDVRAQATRRIRTFDRAVSVADLADLALTMPGIARAAARWDQRLGAVLVVATAQGDPPNPMPAVRAFLDARRDTGVRLTLRGPRPHDLAIAVHVEAAPEWLPEAVTAAVRAALTGRFSFPAQQLGAPGFISEVHALLDALPGVVAAQVSRFATLGRTGAADAVRPAPEGWLRLLPRNLAVTITGRPR
ncbi:putative baseplate assembly protein [Actinomadura sp. 21ATH]|uniref:putative baseplate assembly protein n=1 Tax=Actinomadura sp. 21ATH TaxID=1735444 RepID=UPI0035C0F57F